MTRVTERTRTVYFIRPIGMRGPIKIGCSYSPDGRRNTLETWCPFPLEIVAQVTGSMVQERRFHSMFRDQHQGHEWFTWSPELQAVMDKVASGTFDLDLLPEARSLPRKTLRQGNGWTDKTRRTQSYAMRLHHTERKFKRYLEPDFRGWRGFVDDPARMKVVDDFLSNPETHGVTLQEHNRILADNLRHIDSEWARRRIAELEAA